MNTHIFETFKPSTDRRVRRSVSRLHTMDRFKAWTRENGMLLKRSSVEEHTHLLLNGGKLRVLACDNSFFLSKYAWFLEKGQMLQVVECRTPIFKLMMDVDIKTDTPLTKEQQIQLSHQLHCLASSTFEESGPTILCMAPPELLADGRHKTGIHLVFQNVYVDSQTALSFRRAIIHTSNPNLDLTLQWDDILDSQVYTSAGLRMLGSQKKDGTRAYVPAYLLYDDDVNPVNLDNDGGWKTWVDRTSIRNFSQTITALQQRLPPSLHHVTAHHPSSTSCMDLIEHQHGLSDLKQILPEVYRDVEFTGLKTVGDKCFLQSTSKFCLNADREHSSNRTYFQLQPDGVFQRCHSNKEGGGRLMGNCKKFYSNMFEMPVSLRASLWPSEYPVKRARV